jgi:hypothetical protein
MKIIGSLVLVLLGTAAAAEPVSREERILELVRATGLAEMLEQSRDSARSQAGQLSDQMLGDFLKNARALTAEQSDAVSLAARRFAEACAASFDVNDAVAAWGQYYAATLTDQELDEILGYYSSPIGQKDVAASKSAMPLWQAHLAARSAASMQAAMERYMAELKNIVAQPGP